MTLLCGSCRALQSKIVGHLRQPLAIISQRHLYTTHAQKPFYITTPIFYVNAQPHIGHLYTLVLTDTIKRYRQFMGQSTVMLTGTDEHGMKIQTAAIAAGKEPQALCDEISTVFRDLPSKANVQYDRFIRTTSDDHKFAVSHFWKTLEEKGFIYKSDHSGYYSVSDETFFPPSSISTRKDPNTGEEEHYSLETGNKLIWLSEENYHFRLSNMQEQLLLFYKDNKDFVIPQKRYADIITSVQDGLTDLSISRPSSRLKWGIPVPGDASQTIYVWLDALVNYITAAGYPQLDSLWPADLHVIGKDIVRFHCIYWPAFLLAAGIQPPKSIQTHAHWTMENHKMSKSRGNVVDPWRAIDQFGTDTIRYYLMRDGRIENDGNYSTEHVILRHNHELLHGFGNLVSRLSSASFNLPAILESPPDLATLDTQMAEHVQVVGQLVKNFHSHMSENLVYKAVADAKEIFIGANALLQAIEPWSKKCPEKTRAEALYAAIESVRISALLLQCVMPQTMSSLLDRLTVNPESRTTRHASVASDRTYRARLSKQQPHLFAFIESSV